jgi:hypothetical protein
MSNVSQEPYAGLTKEVFDAAGWRAWPGSHIEVTGPLLGCRINPRHTVTGWQYL